jgi:CheY-like chemotaxis protein
MIVLIVDDEEEFCFLVKKNLESTGAYQVFSAHNGEDGIMLARLKHPDIILLDVMMPDMNGPDVSELLKKDERTRAIPIVFLTAIVKKEEIGVTPMRSIGAHWYIAKPVSTEELIQSIVGVLSGHKEKK